MTGTEANKKGDPSLKVGKETWAQKMNSNNMCLQIKAIRSLKPHEHNALHAFKHKLVGSIHDLYQVIPTDQADAILDSFFREVPPPSDLKQRALDKAAGKNS